jgi:hypothetical protein
MKGTLLVTVSMLHHVLDEERLNQCKSHPFEQYFEMRHVLCSS